MQSLFSFILVATLLMLPEISADISNMYCGKFNCYELLGITSSASTDQIRQAFKKLSRELHPDKNMHKGIDTHKQYQQFICNQNEQYLNILLNREIVRAYEVLKDSNLRESYDGWIANPDQSDYYNYYSYYKAVYAPQTNPGVVLLSTLVFLSFFQYLGRKNMYENALSQVERTDRFKVDVNNLQRENPEKSKEEIKTELLQKIVIEGGYSRLKWQDILIIRFAISPYTFANWIYKKGRWFIKYTIKKDEYTSEDQEVITKRILMIKENQWMGMEQEQRDEFLSKQLWIPANLLQFRKEQLEIQQQRKEQFLSTAKGKKYLRYMKNAK